MWNLLPYLSATVAFCAAIIGVFGRPKWISSNKGLNKLSRTGQIAVSLAVVAAISSIALTWKAQDSARIAESQRKMVRSAAHFELREAIRGLVGTILWALYEVTDEYKYIKIEPKFVPDGIDMLDSKLRTLLAKTDLNARSPFTPLITCNPRWSAAIAQAAERADESIVSIKQTYAAFLESEELVLLHKLQNSQFYHRMLKLEFITQVNVGGQVCPEPSAKEVITHPLSARASSRECLADLGKWIGTDQACCVDDGSDCSVGLGRPLGAEAVGDLAVYHRRS